MYRLLSTLPLLLLLTAGPVRAEEEAQYQPPPDGALQLRLVARKDAYPLRLGGKAPQQFRKHLEEIARDAKNGKSRDDVPPAPAVAITLEIHNTSDREVEIWLGGDDTALTLDLKGQGAASTNYLVYVTADLRGSRPYRLPPGGHIDRPIRTLEDGFRGVGHRLYWTEPGDYTLTATYELGSPSLKKGAGPVLTSAPLHLKAVTPE
jgi:hypothetical protein